MPVRRKNPYLIAAGTAFIVSAVVATRIPGEPPRPVDTVLTILTSVAALANAVVGFTAAGRYFVGVTGTQQRRLAARADAMDVITLLTAVIVAVVHAGLIRFVTLGGIGLMFIAPTLDARFGKRTQISFTGSSVLLTLYGVALCFASVGVIQIVRAHQVTIPSVEYLASAFSMVMFLISH